MAVVSSPPCSGEVLDLLRDTPSGWTLWEGQAPLWEGTWDPGLLILATEPAPSQAGQVARGSCGPSPAKCHLVESLPPCPQAGWARTCLGSISFAGNPWARPRRLPPLPSSAGPCPRSCGPGRWLRLVGSYM